MENGIVNNRLGLFVSKLLSFPWLLTLHNPFYGLDTTAYSRVSMSNPGTSINHHTRLSALFARRQSLSRDSTSVRKPRWGYKQPDSSIKHVDESKIASPFRLQVQYEGARR